MRESSDAAYVGSPRVIIFPLILVQVPAERFYFDTVVEHFELSQSAKLFYCLTSRGPPFRNPKFAVMSENPFEAIRKACDSFGKCFQTHLSRILPARCEDHLDKPSSVARNSKASLFSFFTASNPRAVNDTALLTPDVNALEKKITAAPLTKEELGRATWTLLHTVAAQFPDIPTRQQKRDVKELMAILSRIYPCKECADHFKEVLKSNPVQAGSQAELSQWLCHVHNIVNRSLGKQIFPCQRVNARWGKLDCLDRSCDVQGSTNLNFPA